MTDYTNLLRMLKTYEDGYGLYLDAAAAIESLQAEQKKTVTQIFCEEQAAWEGRCKDLIESVHIRDKHIDELNHYIWELEAKAKEAADAIEELISFDIRNLPEGLYTVKNGMVYTAKVKVSGGNVLNMKTGESHWEDDRIVGGEQVFPKLPKTEVQDDS